jgi:hypothetical protein
MTTMVKTWTDNINQTYSSNVDQAVQYRESLYALLQLFLAAGWTLELSCNSVTANSSNNLTTAANFVYGTNGSQVLAYFVVRAPSGYGSPFNNVTAGQLRICVVANNSNADTTPQTIDVYAGWGAYTLNGTPLSNRPTGPTGELSRTAVNFIPWATATTAYFSTWRTSAGDVMIALKDSATANFSTVLWINAESSALSTCTACLYFANSAAAAFASNILGGAANWRGWIADGSATASVSLTLQCNGWSATNWTLGYEGAIGYLIGFDIDLFNNGATSTARYFGRISDIRGCPTAVAFNDRDSTDTDTQILRCAGDVLMPVTRASGSFL